MQNNIVRQTAGVVISMASTHCLRTTSGCNIIKQLLLHYYDLIVTETGRLKTCVDADE